MSNSYRRAPVGNTRPGGEVISLEEGGREIERETLYIDTQPPAGFDFWSLFRVLSARRWLILAVVVLGVAGAAAFTLRQTPLYRASATVEVQRQEVQIVQGGNVDPVNLADAEYMATQFALLRSRSLAERVAENLRLPNDARYADQEASREARLAQAATAVLTGLSVSPLARSRVVEISYVSSDPQEAARIANGVADNFIKLTLDRRLGTTDYARRFLEDRLEATRVALEESERSLVAYARANGLMDLGDEDASSVGETIEASSLRSLGSALTDAQNERIAAEQRYLAATSNPDVLQSLSSDSIKELRAKRSELIAEYQERAATLKPNYPTMVELQARIDALDGEIQRERSNFVNALRSEFEAAKAREASLSQRVSGLSQSLQDQRSTRIAYNIIRREVDTNRSQYDALLQRLKEVSVAGAVDRSQVQWVDAAKAPTSPFSPNLRRAVILAFALSLAIGVGLALLLDRIDDTIKTPEDVKTKLGLSCIGVVPRVSSETTVVDELSDPRSRASEAFFSARTALQFTTANGAPRTLLITSTRPAEGKTSSAAALGISFAGIGKRVLIIDADMRKPSFVAAAEHSVGLSGLLTTNAPLSKNVVQGSAPNLFLLPSGVIPPNPAELLASPRLRQILAEAQERFDLVLVDSGPVLTFADAPLLGAECEAAILVTQSGAIRTPVMRRTINRLLESRTNIIGVLLSKFDVKKEGYGYGYGYGYAYEDGFSEEGGKKGAKVNASRRFTLFNDATPRKED